MLFEQVDLFPIASAPLVREEETARDGGHADVAQDVEAYKQFASAHAIEGETHFTSLTSAAQRAYFDLWHRSAFVVKRAFHSAVRSMVLVTTYSDDATWPAIGYEGPLR
ncbi:MAG TPA: hypothetical protein VJZ00_01435 [Thermoanaerobaculia bacterium]|nr:hypothetical protein [Thermoanaerobaculia bacterium]